MRPNTKKKYGHELLVMTEEEEKMISTLVSILERIEHKIDRLINTNCLDSNVQLTSPTAGSATCYDFSTNDDDEEPPPDCSDLPDLASKTCSELSQMSFEACNRGDVETGFFFANKALHLNPDSASALRARGNVHLLQEQWAAARADLSAAQQIDYSEAVEPSLKQACEMCSTRNRKATTNADSKPTTNQNLANMLNDPQIMKSVADMLRNPEAMQSIQNSPMFKSMMQGNQFS